MDLGTLALSVYNFVKPVFTSKVAGKIAGDFKEATKGSMIKLWEKIKPWFIIEEKDGEKEKDQLQRVKKDPEKESYQEAFISELKIQLEENPEIAKEIEAILTEMEKGDDEKARIIIKHCKNVNAGTMGDDAHVGDRYEYKADKKE